MFISASTSSVTVTLSPKTTPPVSRGMSISQMTTKPRGGVTPLPASLVE
jgi:hypothetical protein